MITKKFDQQLFQENDEKGKNIVKSFFLRMGIEAIDHPNPYVVDLILQREGELIGYAEVEVRKNWSRDEFPYDTLNVPARKAKYLKNELPTYFFSINYPLTRMFVATDDVVLSSPLKENPNKYVAKGELFYDVALDRCKLIVI